MCQGKLSKFILEDEKVYLIGRSKKSSISINSSSCSLRHLAITIKDGKVSAKDLGSTNGSYLNQHMFCESYFYIGDVLQIADVKIFLLKDKMTEKEIYQNTRDDIENYPEFNGTFSSFVFLQNGVHDKTRNISLHFKDLNKANKSKTMFNGTMIEVQHSLRRQRQEQLKFNLKAILDRKRKIS